jgi:hypothetical protein
MDARAQYSFRDFKRTIVDLLYALQHEREIKLFGTALPREEIKKHARKIDLYRKRFNSLLSHLRDTRQLDVLQEVDRLVSQADRPRIAQRIYGDVFEGSLCDEGVQESTAMGLDLLLAFRELGDGDAGIAATTKIATVLLQKGSLGDVYSSVQWGVHGGQGYVVSLFGMLRLLNLSYASTLDRLITEKLVGNRKLRIRKFTQKLRAQGRSWI